MQIPMTLKYKVKETPGGEPIWEEYQVNVTEDDLIKYFEFKNIKYSDLVAVLEKLYHTTSMFEDWIEKEENEEFDSDFYCWMHDRCSEDFWSEYSED